MDRGEIVRAHAFGDICETGLIGRWRRGGGLEAALAVVLESAGGVPGKRGVETLAAGG
jgi:hypothetical protein